MKSPPSPWTFSLISIQWGKSVYMATTRGPQETVSSNGKIIISGSHVGEEMKSHLVWMQNKALNFVCCCVYRLTHGLVCSLPSFFFFYSPTTKYSQAAFLDESSSTGFKVFFYFLFEQLVFHVLISHVTVKLLLLATNTEAGRCRGYTSRNVFCSFF